MGLGVLHNKLFSQDYFIARDRFINSAIQNKFEIKSYLHPLKGKDNRDIYLDVAYANPNNSQNLLVILSGTHGAEGYCGSAIQLGSLQNYPNSHSLKNNAILLIHAHNPFGFAWDLRFNEDNIDLNRNYINDFSNLPSNYEFGTIKEWAIPHSLEEGEVGLTLKRLMDYARANGYPKLRDALTSGQYKYDNGVYFGGYAQSWSNYTINDILDDYFPRHENIICLDYHTGSGNYGKCEIISSLKEHDYKFKRMQEIWGDIVKSTTSSKSNVGVINGSLEEFVLTKYPATNLLYATPEFGTIDPISIFSAALGSSWIIKNQIDNLDNKQARDVRQLNRDAFAPDDENWRADVARQGIDILLKAADYFE